MDLSINNILFLSGSFCVLLFIGLTIFYFVQKKTNTTVAINITEELVASVLYILRSVIHDYSNYILLPKIGILKSKHDIDPESKTNSIATYTEELNKLYVESVKEILNKYISKDLYSVLLTFWKDEGIILIVLNEFKTITSTDK